MKVPLLFILALLAGAGRSARSQSCDSSVAACPCDQSRQGWCYGGGGGVAELSCGLTDWEDGGSTPGSTVESYCKYDVCGCTGV
jgi:hypothetical protein